MIARFALNLEIRYIDNAHGKLRKIVQFCKNNLQIIENRKVLKQVNVIYVSMKSKSICQYS